MPLGLPTSDFRGWRHPSRMSPPKKRKQDRSEGGLPRVATSEGGNIRGWQHPRVATSYFRGWTSEGGNIRGWRHPSRMSPPLICLAFFFFLSSERGWRHPTSEVDFRGWQHPTSERGWRHPTFRFKVKILKNYRAKFLLLYLILNLQLSTFQIN